MRESELSECFQGEGKGSKEKGGDSAPMHVRMQNTPLGHWRPFAADHLQHSLVYIPINIHWEGNSILTFIFNSSIYPLYMGYSSIYVQFPPYIYILILSYNLQIFRLGNC